MGIFKTAVPIVVALAVVSAVTAILWVIKLAAVGPQHLVFFYLLPTATMAILYGSRVAVLCALVATAAAAFFLYDPVFSFWVANPVEVGELVWFAALALIGAKCAADLLRPTVRLVPQSPAIEGPKSGA